jgi:hypothetical protein
MDWKSGYMASYRLYRVDPSTWADSERVGGLQSANVESDLSKELVQSGSIKVELPVGESFERGYYRLAMVTEQNGGLERFNVSTLYYTTSTRNVSDGSATFPLVGRSVLYPASRRKMLVGSYAPLGVDGAAYAADLLSTAVSAPIVVEGGFTLDEHLVFDVGTTVIKAALSVLRTGGYMASIDGGGTVTIRPVPTEARSDAESLTELVMPSVSDTFDTAEVPNRYTAIDKSQSVTVTNDDPTSESSTVNKGYEDDVVDTSPKRVNGETLSHYARRRLYEMSIVKKPYTYQREYDDSITVGDVMPVTLNGEHVALRSTRQSLACNESGIIVSETAEMEVPLWQG